MANNEELKQPVGLEPSMLANEEKAFSRIFLICLLATLYAAYTIPFIQDESYYLSWIFRSTWPQLGFFDHPPMVSWQGFLARFSETKEFMRLTIWMTALATIFVQTKLVSLYVPLGDRLRLLPALLALGCLGGMVNAVLITPDSSLLFFWTLTIYFAAYALKRDPRFWILAGLAAGLAFYAKYTALFLAPVLFVGLLFERPAHLKTKWPYLGLATTLLVMMPHILWNADHDWVTLRFQFGHGLSSKVELSSGSSLPLATESHQLSRIQLLQRDYLRSLTPESVFSLEESPTKKSRHRSKLEKAWMYMGDYLGGVFILWGGYSLYILSVLTRNRRRVFKFTEDKRVTYGLPLAATIVPLMIFGLLSPFSKIEANWSAIHIPGAIVFLCLMLKETSKRVAWISLVSLAHTSLIVVLAFVTSSSLQKSGNDFIPEFTELKGNRLIQETAGYDQLVSLIGESRSVTEVIAVDSYQLKSAFFLRDPRRPVVQWPGYTRFSEYTRGQPDDFVLEQRLSNQRSFLMISSQKFPKEIPGWYPEYLQKYVTCADQKIYVLTDAVNLDVCKDTAKEWWFIHFKRQNPV